MFHVPDRFKVRYYRGTQRSPSPVCPEAALTASAEASKTAKGQAGADCADDGSFARGSQAAETVERRRHCVSHVSGAFSRLSVGLVYSAATVIAGRDSWRTWPID